MTLKVNVKAWLSERETLPNGVQVRYTRGQVIRGQILLLLVIVITLPLALLLVGVIAGEIGKQSLGSLAAHGVKLAVLSLF
jgi:hypothetical protein